MAKSSFYSGSGLTNTEQDAIEGAKNAAEAARDAAQAAQASAETAETNAETAAASTSTNVSTATTKASEASNSANTASTKAQESVTSAATATTKAQEASASAATATTKAQEASASSATATTKASEAAASANSAASDAVDSAASATTATTKAQEAAASVVTSSNHASTSSTKASEASTSATTATTKAQEASASSATATTKASEASASSATAATKASEASSSASTASTKASEAAASAVTAASEASDAATSSGTATTKASEAAASAVTASGHASTATTKASEASASSATATTKASEASASASTASTKASEASSSASTASAAQTAAEGARDSALAAFDSFDDRYLGVFSTAPTADNDGDSLAAGMLFFDSTASAMKVYTGSAWVAAYISGSDYLPLTGGTLTGAVTFASTQTFDGRDLSADGFKLDLIEASADVTDAVNVNPLVDSHLNTSTASSGEYLSWNGSDYAWSSVAAGYGDSDVDTHLNTSGASTNQYLKWNGSDYAWSTVDLSNVDAVTGTTITGTGFVSTGNMTFGDNNKAIFGAGSDLQIFHDGSHSYISDQGTGNLRILAGEFNVKSASGNTDLIYGVNGGAVTLYHNGNAMISTTSTGIDISGDLNAVDNIVLATAMYHEGDTDTFLSFGSGGDSINLVTGGAARLSATNTGIDVTGTVTATHASNATIDAVTTGGATTRISSASTAGYLGTTTNHPALFITNGSERMRIANSGHVGINFSDPASTGSRLAVQGDAGSNAVFVKGNTGLGTSWGLGVNAGSTSADASFRVYDKDGSNSYLFVRGDGKIGIGTSSPPNRLSVKQSGNTSAASFGVVSINSANDTYIGMGYDSSSDTNRISSSYSSSGAYKPITFLTSDTERMRIENDGNTIINHNNNNYDDGLILRSTLDWGYGTSLSFDAVTSSGGSNGTVGKIQSRWQSAGNHALDFYTYGSGYLTQKARLDATGLAINTTTVSYPLTVKGIVGFEATNSTNAWAAYTYTDNTLRINYNGSGGDEVIIDTSGNMTLSYGSLIVPSNIQHLGDTDTYLQFDAADSFRIIAGNTQTIKTTSSAITNSLNTTFTESLQIQSGAGSGNPIRIGNGFGTGGNATIQKYNADLYFQYANGLSSTNVRLGGGGTVCSLDMQSGAITNASSVTATGDLTGNAVYISNWARFYGETGLYSQSYGQHFYPDSGGFYWESDGPIRIRDGHEGTIKGYLGYHDSSGFGLLNEGGNYWLNTPGSQLYLAIGGSSGSNPWSSVTGVRLMFGSANSSAIGNYYIGTNLENYGGNYNKLDFRFHTGIRMGAQATYGGVRIFDSEALGTVLFSVGAGSTNVAVTNDLSVGGSLTVGGVAVGGSGGGSTFDATASGAIANGDTCCVNQDGTVSAIALSSTAQGSTTPAVIAAESSDYPHIAYGNGKVVAVFRDSNGYFAAVVGESNGSGGVSWGTKTTLVSYSAYYPRIAYVASVDKFFVLFRNSSQSNRMWYGSITVSGTTPTWSLGSWDNANVSYMDICACPEDDSVFVVGKNNNWCRGWIGRIATDGTVSLGSMTTIDSQTIYRPSCVWDSSVERVIVAFRTYYVSVAVLQITGSYTFSNLNTSSWSQSGPEGGSYDNIPMATDNKGNLVVCVDKYSPTDTKIVQAVLGSSGITWSSEQLVHTNEAYDAELTYDSNADVFHLYYEIASSDAFSATYTIGTSSLTAGSVQTIEANSTFNPFKATGVYFPDIFRSVFVAPDNRDSNKLNGWTFNGAFSSSNLGADNYIGVANAAYSNGATATIQIVGSVDDAQSGLTPSKKYYVQQDGSLSQTADTPSVVAGTAVAATKLIVKG